MSRYLDNANCFNATLLAEVFIGKEDCKDEDEESDYFDAAAVVSEWAVKTFNLNE